MIVLTGTSSLLDKYRHLWDDMDQSLKDYKTEARQLREESFGDPSYGDGVGALHQRLVSLQRSLHRMTTILGDVGFIRSRLRSLVSDLNDAYEDKWREAFNAAQTGEYMSAKEKDAMYTTRAVQELINLRRAKRMLNDTEAVYELINLYHRSMDSSRRDTDTRLRVISGERF